MLFDVTRGELADVFGEDRIATVPATAFPPAAADSEGARLLQTVGVPTGTLLLRQPHEDDGLLPLVQDVVHIEDFEDAPAGAGDWPVIGWLLNAHLALDPVSGTVHAFDPDEEAVRELHTDVSSLVQVTFRFQRLLEEFTFGDGGDRDGGDDEEAGFERLDGEVGRIRAETSGIDPLPFQDDDTVWSVVGDEIAMGQRFEGNSPGARSLYG
ncbi:SUKH-4 family immunity protein [Streptomyces actinomycinicus]|uniref:SUKH-4 family immunity protein n=1 Tax=Streptomyces actinomycinicus TaxID=1695166 RepID=A0A937JL07_9ACTN|nr:SUKH-4 family immunity protein [Streptomyces actinomycinicus]MBL1083094.1 SUKH-4 family immunity protein [Streptomyces actinomycinicus]